eukprot:8255734-Lingulodinium_polyedra.AAC.1
MLRTRASRLHALPNGTRVRVLHAHAAQTQLVRARNQTPTAAGGAERTVQNARRAMRDARRKMPDTRRAARGAELEARDARRETRNAWHGGL